MVGPSESMVGAIESLSMHYRAIIINLVLYIKLKKLMSNFVHFYPGYPILPLFLGVDWALARTQVQDVLLKVLSLGELSPPKL